MQIKFKALCESTREWVYGLPKTGTTLSNTIEFIEQFAGSTRKFGRSNVKIIPATICVFTGFLDCKGIEIYGGDILSDWEEVDGEMIQSRLQVFWDLEKGAWMVDSSYKQDKSNSYFLHQDLKDFKYEVTGNIHQK